MAKGKQKHKIDPFDVFANAYGFYATAIVLDRQMSTKSSRTFSYGRCLSTNHSVLSYFSNRYMSCAEGTRRNTSIRFGCHTKTSTRLTNARSRENIAKCLLRTHCVRNF